MIRLYDYELSGNCYKIRLLCGFLGLAYTSVPIEFHPGRAHKGADFLRINPLGQLPVIDDDGFVLRDAQAILTYLAARYDPARTWYPVSDARLLGEVGQWLAFADSITATASAARLHDSFFHDLDVDAARAGAHRLFRILDAHLWFAEQEGRIWLCPAPQPTIADIACFPYVILSEEGGIFLQDYPAIRRWCDRVKRIPGFVPMPGVFPAGPGLPPPLTAGSV
ncbi:MAG: glutathione S-transferase [Rhodobacterales bacterium]|jgi:glutathione S-transferase|nr:glutathione S-transferase [Rhodobacterales bacterium]